MRWEPLVEVLVDEFFDAPLKAKVDVVNRRVRQLLQNREGLERRIADARNQSVEEVDFNSLPLDSYRTDRAVILQEESRVRAQIAALEAEVSASIREASDEAWNAIEKTQRDVRKQLVKIGYIDAEATSAVVGKITQGMVLAHPRVRAAKEKHDSLSGRVSVRDFWRSNDESRRLVDEELNRSLERLIPKS